MDLPNWLNRLVSIPDVKDVLLFDRECLIDRGFGLEKVRSPFLSVEEFSKSLSELAFEFGARLDIASPLLDLSIGKLRLHMLIPHGICNYPSLSIRIHSEENLRLEDLVELQMLTKAQADFLMQSVAEKKTLVISGATSSGKTTLLRALLTESSERIITIEQVPELHLNYPAISLTARENNQEGVGEITLSDLVVQSLRMRPDRIVVGEVRRDEFIAFLQAVSNGHPGSLTTVHASSLTQASERFLILGLLSNISSEITSRLVASCIDLVIQLGKENGKRKVVSIGRPELVSGELRMVV
jgi:pilus assembly protein CpaF